MPLGETLSAEQGRYLDAQTGRYVMHGVAIWRPDGSEEYRISMTVGEFLGRPEHQCGAWLIDAGWGGPPGPIRVRWVEGEWENDGFPPW